MAKTKRWQNFQNSVQTQPTLSVQPNAQPTTSQSISSVQAKKQMTSSVQATSQPVQSTQAASQSISSNQAVSHSTSSSQAKSQPKSFKKRVVGRESTEYCTVEAIGKLYTSAFFFIFFYSSPFVLFFFFLLEGLVLFSPSLFIFFSTYSLHFNHKVKKIQVSWFPLNVLMIKSHYCCS